jgi:hypothetical protein
MSDLRAKVTFVTSATGTKWESYSQALLRASFPECRRVVADGTRGWDPLYFVEIARHVSTEYVVLVDEDCFVFDRAQFGEMLRWLQDDPTIAVVATPDGGTFHRDYNPAACNTFFAIIRRDALRTATSRDGWRQLRWGDVRAKAAIDHVAHLDSARINWDFDERYYPFFWAVLEAGFKIRYVVPDLNKELLASELRTKHAEGPMLLHMWWLRTWHEATPEPYLGVPNRRRYEMLERVWLKPRFADARLRALLLRENTLRRSRNAVRALRRYAGRVQARLLVRTS